jgi:hypothetical protein
VKSHEGTVNGDQITLYVRLETVLNNEVHGKLVMNLGTADKSQTFGQALMPLDMVPGFGAAHFFQAANRYIMQNNSKHYYGVKTYYGLVFNDQIDIVVRNEKYSKMKTFDAYWNPPSGSGTQSVRSPPLFGVKAVATTPENSTWDEVINGNFVHGAPISQPGGSVVSSYGNTISTQCLGNLITGNYLDAATSTSSTSSSFLDGTNARYLDMTAGSPGTPNQFAFGTGILTTPMPPTAPSTYQEAMGGLGPTATGVPNTLSAGDTVHLIGEAQVDSQNRVLFTLSDASSPSKYHLGAGGDNNASIVRDATINSGCALLPGSTTEYELFYTDGDSSMGLYLQDPKNTPQPLISSAKQNGGYYLGPVWRPLYYVNTYLLFDSDPPHRGISSPPAP